MARSIKIKSIRQRGDYWHIRYGKTHIEVPGTNKAALRQWIREQLDESDQLAVVLALAATLKRDQDLTGLDALEGQTVTLDLNGNLNSVDGIVRLFNG